MVLPIHWMRDEREDPLSEDPQKLHSDGKLL